MNGKGKYKFKVINGILSWKNDEMEKYKPISAEILTRVLLLYEQEIKHGIDIWNAIQFEHDVTDHTGISDERYRDLMNWMGNLSGIFGEEASTGQKKSWSDEYPLNLN